MHERQADPNPVPSIKPAPEDNTTFIVVGMRMPARLLSPILIIFNSCSSSPSVCAVFAVFGLAGIAVVYSTKLRRGKIAQPEVLNVRTLALMAAATAAPEATMSYAFVEKDLAEPVAPTQDGYYLEDEAL